MRSPRALVRDIAGIRESELGRLLLMAAYLLLIITCYTTTKAVRDSLFVIEIGPSRLPYLYVLSALTMAAISAIYSRSVNRIGLRTIIRITTLLAIAQLILFWWLAGSQTALWFYVLYVWVSIFGAITASQAWLLSTHVFDAREARRLFGWIGVGGILGGICGGALARFIAPWLGTESLLLVCAGLMGLTVIILAQIPRPVDQQVAGKAGSEPRGTAATEDIRIFAEIRKSPHVSLLIALLVVGVIVEAFGDYTFKFIASQSFDS
jgi:ATP:ADP antiporter, AAA family